MPELSMLSLRPANPKRHDYAHAPSWETEEWWQPPVEEPPPPLEMEETGRRLGEWAEDGKPPWADTDSEEEAAPPPWKAGLDKHPVAEASFYPFNRKSNFPERRFYNLGPTAALAH